MGSDTVLVITKPQLVTINRSLNDYIHLKKINKNLRMDLSASDSLISYWRQISIKKDTVIFFNAAKFEEQTKYNESLRKSLALEKRKKRKAIIGVGVGGTLIGIILGVMLK